MGELSSVVGGAYCSARQASGCPRALAPYIYLYIRLWAPGRGQPHPNLAPKLMTTCNPAINYPGRILYTGIVCTGTPVQTITTVSPI